MQLIVILLATVGILTFLSGAIVFFGSSKEDRARSIWYFIAAIFATIWMTSIALFLSQKPTADGLIPDSLIFHVNCTFVSAIILDVAFLGYGSWNKRYGKILTIVFLLMALAISAMILINPNAMYSEIIVSNQGNSLMINFGPLYFCYIIYFCLIVPTITAVFLRQYFKSRAKRKRNSNLVMMLAYGISSTIVLVVNLILPIFNNWSMIWLGPLALGTTIIIIYYMILKYQTLDMSVAWLRIFSYVVVVASIAILYMVIFSVIFAALFRGSTPSIEVIILNFIMILIFIALMPAMNGLIKFISSLILAQHPKQVKKLEAEQARLKAKQAEIGARIAKLYAEDSKKKHKEHHKS